MCLFHAQHTPHDFLNSHNTARAQVGVDPITWNIAVASYAEHHANHRDSNCTMVRSGGPYGENLAGSTGCITSAAAVNS
ncbi:hypothetical protein GIB67_025412 [Kingdonia uniflora]|uniref:SCP domain-containing protein n=1 Tax=Kingdonia uniflora TaxID=39325 RepID=A0A7J7LA20_9MAGN|nr:hypothetical protein GIB67_025412 [Kingdonia uniflora]